MLAFAKALPQLARFVHISTAYVAGQRKGLIREDAALPERFGSLYEQSKAEAEKLVTSSGLPYCICRPSMIVGHSQTGRIRSFNTIYYVLKLLLTEKLPLVPASKSQKINMIPVDVVACGVVGAMQAADGAGKVYHLTCPHNQAPTAGDLLDAVCAWAPKNLGFQLRKPLFLSMPYLKKAGQQYNRKADSKQKNFFSNLLALMPYFYDEHQFDRAHTDTLPGMTSIDWHTTLDAQLTYACRKNFMHQTGQTLFEQANVRRRSRTIPVTYHDVTDTGITDLSGPDMNAKVHQIAGALYAQGVRRGSRVAVAGINCTDYLALDMALGLLGAVSVPIYYTTPIHEAQALLERSSVRWFFVGDARIMTHIDELSAPVQLIAFAKASEAAWQRKDVLSWADFLAQAVDAWPDQTPAPDDLATIRYTSGTTGEPKGVMFNYAQLKWMGEVLTNLLSWRERNKRMRYMSFLPLSHVVEGILAAYAPYCMLCKTDLYYLNDFGALTQALPKVRPTVFFSVPRFYEKLWQQLA